MARQILHEEKSPARVVRAALYARVSTANNGQDPTMQTRELREYCERRGWKVSGEYVDEGISGAKDSRPELNKLVADAHRRRFDAVVVWRFDRFARSVSHLLRALETFEALRIEFVSLSEQVDTSTPTGKMVFTVLGAVAELERSLIAERVKAGLRNARAKGKRMGRPPVAVDAARIASLRAHGRSWREVTTEMGISKGSAQRAYWGLPKNVALDKSLVGRGKRDTENRAAKNLRSCTRSTGDSRQSPKLVKPYSPTNATPPKCSFQN